LFSKRVGLVVWLKDLRAAKNLGRFGNVHYISKRLKYAVVYVNAAEAEQKALHLGKLHFVKKVEYSYRHEIEQTIS